MTKATAVPSRCSHGSISASRPHLRHRRSAPATPVGALGAQSQNKKSAVLKIDARRAMEHKKPDEIASESISIARYRELLDDEAEGLSDQEVDLIRHHADAMAHVLVQMFLENGAASNE
jgi:hypothetical protein